MMPESFFSREISSASAQPKRDISCAGHAQHHDTSEGNGSRFLVLLDERSGNPKKLFDHIFGGFAGEVSRHGQECNEDKDATDRELVFGAPACT
jgi:hypothetical protein